MLRKDIVMKIEIEIPDDELKEVITQVIAKELCADYAEKVISPNSSMYDRGKGVIKVITGTSDVSGKKWRIVSPIKDIDGTAGSIIDRVVKIAS